MSAEESGCSHRDQRQHREARERGVSIHCDRGECWGVRMWLEAEVGRQHGINEVSLGLQRRC